MGILDIVLHAAVGIGGICTGVKHGKALYDGMKSDLASKKQKEEEETEETTEE